MALMVFAIVLNRNGWRIGYLGSKRPGRGAGARAVGATRPDLVVLAATVPETLEPLRPQLGSLARRAPLALLEPAPRRRSRPRWGPSCWRATQ